MEDRPLILVTNDDGIRSPGLLAAAEAAADIGDILIAAPHVQQTGMGRAFVRDKETGIIDVHDMEIKGRHIKGYGVHGTPAFSVAHAVLELADRKPDLCVSGINYGENMGSVLTCSGTMGAAFEAATYGIPAIAVSLETQIEVQRSETFMKIDFSCAARILRIWMEKVLSGAMVPGADILNINVPAAPAQKGEWRLTSQSRQNYFEFVKPEKRDLGKPVPLKVRKWVDMDSLEKDSDIYAVYVDKTASVTPICVNMSVL